jgi:hypothetical protein
LNGLINFLFRIHDKRTISGNRFIERLSIHYQHDEFLGSVYFDGLNRRI